MDGCIRNLAIAVDVEEIGSHCPELLLTIDLSAKHPGTRAIVLDTLDVELPDRTQNR